MVTGEAAGAPRSSLVIVERSTPLILASSCWVSCLRWRSFFRLVSLRTLQILTKLVHAAQAASLSLFTGLPTRRVLGNQYAVLRIVMRWDWGKGPIYSPMGAVDKTTCSGLDGYAGTGKGWRVWLFSKASVSFLPFSVALSVT